jgi:hypothetical protein
MVIAADGTGMALGSILTFHDTGGSFVALVGEIYVRHLEYRPV